MTKLKLLGGSEKEIIILFNQKNRSSDSTNFNPQKYKDRGFKFKEFHLDLSKDRERFSDLKKHINLSSDLQTCLH